MKQPRSRTLKLGHLYSVDWADHFSTSRTQSDDPSTSIPVRMRTYGRLVEVTDQIVKVETARRTDMGTESYNHCTFGILRPCILSMDDLGPDPGSRSK